ncbi:hypothetical protein GCM10023116_32540 [Kistimonas scapharcae]|uniref:Tetratricopeptide repeat protein n=2 Tax=Kistimonas scapharcae TaxID=1036133 RepID=A0ABP8V599_9GAMM
MGLLLERLKLYQASDKGADTAMLELTATIMFLQLGSHNPSIAIETAKHLPEHISRKGKEAARLLLILGEAWRQLGNYHHAERAYQLALIESGNNAVKLSIIARYADLLRETHRSLTAIELLSQLEEFKPQVIPSELSLYNNDKARGLILYSQLLMERAQAKPELRAESAKKVLGLVTEAMKLGVEELPKTSLFLGTQLFVSLEAGKAFETMGYRNEAIELYNIAQPYLYQHYQQDPAIARAAWDVVVRHSKLTNVDNDQQVRFAKARVNAYLETFPADSQPLLEPLTSLALAHFSNGQEDEARRLIDHAISNYAKPIADYGVCSSGLESLYAGNLVKMYDPISLLGHADTILTRLLIANVVSTDLKCPPFTDPK